MTAIGPYLLGARIRREAAGALALVFTRARARASARDLAPASSVRKRVRLPLSAWDDTAAVSRPLSLPHGLQRTLDVASYPGDDHPGRPPRRQGRDRRRWTSHCR